MFIHTLVSIIQYSHIRLVISREVAGRSLLLAFR